MGLLSTIGAASGRAFGLTRVGAAIRDAYFNLTTLLLPGNGTNGAQNNTFLDSSSNNFTITRNGNTTQGTFSPFSQTGWSNVCPVGGTDFLNAGSQTAYSFGTGKYTIEFFVYPTIAASADNTFLSVEQINTGWTVSRNANTGVALGIRGVGNVVATTSYQIPLNQWTHVVITRNSTGTNDTRIFINGTLAVAGTDANNWAATGALYLMATGVAGYNSSGYISNVRLIKGSIPTAYQTSSTTAGTSIFTSPTSALTTTSQGATATDVSLLTCQSNRFIDNSNNNFAIAIGGGSPSVQAFSPFAPTAAYSAATVGGSGYFDGSGDYLQTPSSSNLAFGTGDFCVEFWFYRTANVTCGLYSNSTGSAGGDTQFEIQNTSGNKISLIGWNTVFMTSATSTVLNAWTHVAVVRSGTSMAIFFNGVRDATATSANNFSSTNAFVVGLQATGAGPFAGYISGLRTVKGSSVYDPAQTSITIPTAPPTAITNTQLLLNYTNAGITDATAKNDLETVGNAQISTTQSKFGGSSISFDGTGDYLTFPASQNWRFGTGDFTIEFWLYANSLSSTAIFVECRNNTVGPVIFYDSGALRVNFNSAGGVLITGGALSTATWYHIALARSGSSTRLFVNGTQSGSTATDTNNYDNNTLIVGASYLLTQALNGYIDDLRITKGYARYTANFTAPTAAFPLQ